LLHPADLLDEGNPVGIHCSEQLFEKPQKKSPDFKSIDSISYNFMAQQLTDVPQFKGLKECSGSFLCYTVFAKT
jgi:hypothetical protein